MHAYFETNRGLWNGWAKLHERSAFYDVEGFRAGASSLKAVEREELGDVAGKSLLHLQCHFGLDTLSWARLGARVVGVDLSDEAIAIARRLSQETKIPADFVWANVYDVPRVLPEPLPRQYDIVFTSYGVVTWLPDLARWAEAIAASLVPGGTFYMVEFHPVAFAVGRDGRTLSNVYFSTPEPLVVEERGSYADRDADFVHTSYQFAHTIGDVVTALVGAGLRLTFLHEFPYSTWGSLPYTKEKTPGEWRVASDGPDVPLMFSVRATKP